MISRKKQQLEQYLRGPELQTCPERDDQVLETALELFRKNQQNVNNLNVWRIAMNSRIIKTSVAALVILTVTLGIWMHGTNEVWAVEQTIEAIQKLETLHVKGECFWGSDSDPEILDFDFWVQFPAEDSEELKMRFECDKRIVIVEGKTAYECRPKEKSVNIVNGSDFAELQIWYKSAEFSPWLTGKMFWVLRQFSDDWKQVVQYDPSTGKKQILVTCSYPSDTSYSIVVDDESKLIQTATMLLKGHPCVNAQAFTYNQEVPSDAFKVPADYNIVDEKAIEESRALYNRAGQLFVEKKYTEALKLYQQGYEQYGSLDNGRVGAEMLYMVGMCYPEIGQFDKMLDTFLKHISEFSHLEGSDDAHYCLGRAYEELGQIEKALEAYEKCLDICEGIREPDQYRLKNVRKRMEKIKAEVK
ncbi:MAG: tetratricopeptide repeat protein [Planctomycetes bacterium]|nr:tetratricopeptide repeat protein [Planctomycetota bacterium]MBL7143251.1 tetratricopeptide repeat protein [Phycisphaerae bacterium]